MDLITVRQCKTTQIITQSVTELPVSNKTIAEGRTGRRCTRHQTHRSTKTFRNLLTFAHIQIN